MQYEEAANPVLHTLDGQGNGWEHTGEVDFAKQLKEGAKGVGVI